MKENARGYAEVAEYAARLLLNPLVGFSREERILLHGWTDEYLARFEASLSCIPHAREHIAEEIFHPQTGLAHLVFNLSLQQA